MKRLFLYCLLLFSLPCRAAEPVSLHELLERVKQERGWEKEKLAERELKFRNARADQKKLLDAAKSALQEADTRSASLRKTYDDNDLEIARQQTVLNQKTGALGELDGIVKHIAGDLDVIIDTSLVSAQKPGRANILNILSRRKGLPSLEELEELWLLAMDEMVESGTIVTFPGKIITAAGNEIEQNVTRVGVFNAVSAGRFLRNLPETGKLIEPGRQPGRHFQTMAQDLENTKDGIVPFPIDPTRGAILALLVQVPDLKNRITQGGLIGYVILFIGLAGILISLERFIVLSITDKKVTRQLTNKTPGDNPLGRIIRVYLNNPDVDTETLGLKLDEAILKELPKLQRGLGAIALLAAVSPLLGLLGTVTGIIETFQSITLFGTGDPRVMSGGISQALVTTVMGLLVAIPLLLFHSFLSARRNRLIQLLDEKSTAYVAQLAESRRSKK